MQMGSGLSTQWGGGGAVGGVIGDLGLFLGPWVGVPTVLAGGYAGSEYGEQIGEEWYRSHPEFFDAVLDTGREAFDVAHNMLAMPVALSSVLHTLLTEDMSNMSIEEIAAELDTKLEAMPEGARKAAVATAEVAVQLYRDVAEMGGDAVDLIYNAKKSVLDAAVALYD